MRIGINCQLLGGVHSGVEYYVLGLVDSLLRIDHENEYVLFCDRRAGLADRYRDRKNATICDSFTGQFGRASRIAWEQAVLPRLTRRHHLDVLHCPAYVSPAIKTVPTVLTVHDTIALDHPDWCRTSNVLHFRLLLKRSIANADRVIAVSRSTAAAVARHAPAATAKTEVIYPGIDEIFRPVTDPFELERVRLKYRLPEPFVLSVGNLEPKKNLVGTLRAFEEFRAMGHENGYLVVAGGRQWGTRRLLTAERRAGRLRNVVFAGYIQREDLPTLYSLAKALVFPSLYEGFGFPPLEAMACETPVVASQCGALAETLGDGVEPVDPCRPSEIASALRRVLEDSSFRNRMVQRGLKSVGRFTWNAAARQTLQTYARILAF